MKLFLLDAMALIYRAHFSFQQSRRVTTTGLDTSAVYGFINTLLEAIEKEKPTHLAVAFDTAAPTFRHELTDTYKAGREEVPEDIIGALPYIYRLLEAMRIPALTFDGFEADDIIGTLAVQAAQNGAEVYIMSMDKDYAQLVTDSIFLYRPTTGGKGPEILNRAAVIEKFGVPPDRITDLFGLQGDAVDNIPGVPKIGPKTAQKLLAEFDTLENLLANLDKVSAKAVRESLTNHAEDGRFSKLLATIRTDVPLDYDPESAELSGFDAPALEALLNELEFKSVKSRLITKGHLPSANSLFAEKTEDAPPVQTIFQTIKDVAHDYRICKDAPARAELIRRLQDAPSFCFDSETTGLDALTVDIVGLSFALEPGLAYYVPIDARETVEEFRSVFENEKISKIGQNIKYDMQVLANYDIAVKGEFFDTMLAHYVCHSERKHNMDALAKTYLGYEPIPISALIGEKGKKQLSMRDVPLERIAEYAAEDADVTLRIYKALSDELNKEESLRPVFETIEIPLIPVLAAMERAGVRIDADFLRRYAVDIKKDMEILEADVYALAGEKFNLNSPKQLGELLFDKLKIDPNAKKTRTGQYSTDEETLTALAVQGHAIPEKLIQYRRLAKLLSTYVDALPLMVNPNTGKVHTTFNQSIAVTGRLSSQNPNLQNIPIKTDVGKEVRKAFIPRGPGWTLLSADYSQIELRIMAAMSGDLPMVEAFQTGVDIHTATAARVFGVSLENVTSDMRRNAKMVNFGIIYGITAFGLAQRLAIPQSEAKTIISEYFKQYPRVREYMQECVARAKTNGYATTLSGRRHALPAIHSRNATERSFAERNAINTPIQGTAADMIKLAMIRLHARLRDFETKMILQVHDELLFDAPDHEIEKVRSIILETMQGAIPGVFAHEVPMEANVGQGQNWLDAH